MHAKHHIGIADSCHCLVLDLPVSLQLKQAWKLVGKQQWLPTNWMEERLLVITHTNQYDRDTFGPGNLTSLQVGQFRPAKPKLHLHANAIITQATIQSDRQSKPGAGPTCCCKEPPAAAAAAAAARHALQRNKRSHQHYLS
jgi:hypothetical protein